MLWAKQPKVRTFSWCHVPISNGFPIPPGCGQAFRGPTLFGTRNSQVVFERAIYATGNVNRSKPVVDLNLFLHKLGILSGQTIVTLL